VLSDSLTVNARLPGCVAGKQSKERPHIGNFQQNLPFAIVLRPFGHANTFHGKLPVFLLAGHDAIFHADSNSRNRSGFLFWDALYCALLLRMRRGRIGGQLISAKLPELLTARRLKPINDGADHDGADHKCADRGCSDQGQAELQSLTVQIAIRCKQ